MLPLRPMPDVYVTVERARYSKSLRPAGRSGHSALPIKRRLVVNDRQISKALLFTPAAMQALQLDQDNDADLYDLPMIREIHI